MSADQVSTPSQEMTDQIRETYKRQVEDKQRELNKAHREIGRLQLELEDKSAQIGEKEEDLRRAQDDLEKAKGKASGNLVNSLQQEKLDKEHAIAERAHAIAERDHAMDKIAKLEMRNSELQGYRRRDWEVIERFSTAIQVKLMDNIQELVQYHDSIHKSGYSGKGFDPAEYRSPGLDGISQGTPPLVEQHSTSNDMVSPLIGSAAGSEAASEEDDLQEVEKSDSEPESSEAKKETVGLFKPAAADSPKPKVVDPPAAYRALPPSSPSLDRQLASMDILRKREPSLSGSLKDDRLVLDKTPLRQGLEEDSGLWVPSRAMKNRTLLDTHSPPCSLRALPQSRTPSAVSSASRALSLALHDEDPESSTQEGKQSASQSYRTTASSMRPFATVAVEGPRKMKKPTFEDVSQRLDRYSPARPLCPLDFKSKISPSLSSNDDNQILSEDRFNWHLLSEILPYAQTFVSADTSHRQRLYKPGISDLQSTLSRSCAEMQAGEKRRPATQPENKVGIAIHQNTKVRINNSDSPPLNNWTPDWKNFQNPNRAPKVALKVGEGPVVGGAGSHPPGCALNLFLDGGANGQPSISVMIRFNKRNKGQAKALFTENEDVHRFVIRYEFNSTIGSDNHGDDLYLVESFSHGAFDPSQPPEVPDLLWKQGCAATQTCKPTNHFKIITMKMKVRGVRVVEGEIPKNLQYHPDTLFAKAVTELLDGPFPSTIVLWFEWKKHAVASEKCLNYLQRALELRPPQPM